jgi:hypothetical protein
MSGQGHGDDALQRAEEALSVAEDTQTALLQFKNSLQVEKEGARDKEAEKDLLEKEQRSQLFPYYSESSRQTTLLTRFKMACDCSGWQSNAMDQHVIHCVQCCHLCDTSWPLFS